MTRRNEHSDQPSIREEAGPRMRETGAEAESHDGAMPLPPAVARVRGFAGWASF